MNPDTEGQKPQNIEAEQSLLGSLLIDGHALHLIRDSIKASDFFLTRHGWIYQAICRLGDTDKPIDQLTVADELQLSGRLEEVGHYPYLTELLNVTPTAIHIEYYAQIVKENSIKRQLIDASAAIAKISYNGHSADDAIQQAQSIISQIAVGNLTHRPKPVSDFAAALLDEVNAYIDGNRKPGLSTGLTDLDRALGGLKGGKLYILAGRPGMGKSSLGLQTAIVAGRQGKTVLYFSLEMMGVELTIRMVSAQTGLDGKKIEEGSFTGDDYNLFNSGLDEVRKWPVYIDDRTRTVEGIRARATLQAADELDLIVVDYIQRVQVGKGFDNRNAEVGAVSAMLKDLANDLNIPVVTIASLNRQTENRADKRPMLSDLRDSGDLEYDADVVLFIYRDEIYNPDTELQGVAEIAISKHRGGQTGITKAYFKKQTTEFKDLDFSTTGDLNR